MKRKKKLSSVGLIERKKQFSFLLITIRLGFFFVIYYVLFVSFCSGKLVSVGFVKRIFFLLKPIRKDIREFQVDYFIKLIILYKCIWYYELEKKEVYGKQLEMETGHLLTNWWSTITEIGISKVKGNGAG